MIKNIYIYIKTQRNNTHIHTFPLPTNTHYITKQENESSVVSTRGVDLLCPPDAVHYPHRHGVRVGIRLSICLFKQRFLWPQKMVRKPIVFYIHRKWFESSKISMATENGSNNAVIYGYRKWLGKGSVFYGHR